MHVKKKKIRVHYITYKYINILHVYIFVCACVYVCMCCVYVTKINTYKRCINTCMHYIHKYIHIWYMYTYLCVHVHICVYVVCMLHNNICIYVCTYMYTYTSGTDALKILTNCHNTLQPRLQQTRTLSRASNTCALKTSTKLLQHTATQTATNCSRHAYSLGHPTLALWRHRRNRRNTRPHIATHCLQHTACNTLQSRLQRTTCMYAYIYIYMNLFI